jgi:Flp pilus assembly protein TadD
MEEAATQLSSAAAGLPHARVAYNAGLALSRVGRDAEAERLLRRAVAMEPSSYDSLFALGDLLLRLGRKEEVGSIADRMAVIDSTRPEAAHLRSRLGGR